MSSTTSARSSNSLGTHVIASTSQFENQGHSTGSFLIGDAELAAPSASLR
eukprot:m.172490 g.172490  ORF g.172490 m.172490 type:complete len:50 (-) comp53268_c0_seq34:718-867(-)